MFTSLSQCSTYRFSMLLLGYLVQSGLWRRRAFPFARVFWRNNWILSTGDLYESIDYEIEEQIPISRKSIRRPRVLDDPIQIVDLKDFNVQRLFIRSPKLEWVSYGPADLW